MTVPVNSNVSPALDPETYRAVDGYNDSTRGYVDDVVGVFNDIYATVGQLHKARALADSNPSWTEEQKVLIVGAEATKQKARLAQKLDRCNHDLNSRIAHTEGELLRPVQVAAANPLAQEVRAHMKTLTSGERSKLLREALATDDTPTLEAVLGAQPFLSGMSVIDRDHFIGLFHAKRSPHLVERLDLMKRVRDLMSTSGANGSVFHSAFNKAVGAKPHEVSAIQKANQRALDALKIEPTT
jgi:hypothetical protein